MKSAFTFVIGDIHGGLRALQQVLDKARPGADDTLVFLGDYVDGWSESAGVIDYLMQLEQQHHCIFIKGNHDAWCEVWLRSADTEHLWLVSGGAATIASYESYSDAQRLRHLNFLERMKMYYLDEQNRLFIHAGFTSMHGPKGERYETIFYWDRSLWEMALSINPALTPDDLFYPKRLKHFREIYIGHTPTTNYGISTPMNGGNVWNADTGAAFSGPLTIINADTKQFWQSDTVRQLYPGEAGRQR
jgi:serine/threonine protein phosphatase 1